MAQGLGNHKESFYRYDAFISYSHNDRSWVDCVFLPKLEKEGLRICIDYRNFVIGLPSLTNMENAIEQSRKTLLILTPNWVESEWTNFESLLLQTKDPINRGQRLLPIMTQHCHLPNRLGIFTYLDLTKPAEFNQQIQRLISAIKSPSVDQKPGLSTPNTSEKSSLPIYTPIRNFVYELGLSKLGESLAQSAPETLVGFAVLESRLLDNIQDERRYGNSEVIRSERARIVEELNRLAITTLGRSFNDLCKI